MLGSNEAVYLLLNVLAFKKLFILKKCKSHRKFIRIIK